MTSIIQDSVETLSSEDRQKYQSGNLATLLYADDTLLVGESGPILQRLLDAIATTGTAYGIELHWETFQLLQIKGEFVVNAPDGTQINAATTMSYLGSTLREDGTIRNEICRRLGVGWADFSKMARLWRHTSLPRARKVQIFQAVVTSKVLYGLSSAWLNVCEQRRIDGFQARCLRSVLGIKPAYWSGVSNLKVLEQSCQRPYSK